MSVLGIIIVIFFVLALVILLFFEIRGLVRSIKKYKQAKKDKEKQSDNDVNK